MNKILFSERLANRRKECGYKTQYALAEEYNKRFPSSRKNRKEENSGNSSGIWGTIKNYENANYNGSPKLEIVDNLCKILECDIDYLLGNIDCKTHDTQFIHNKTGLSEEAISELMYIKTLNDIVVEDIDLPTINVLIEQLGEPKSIIRWITAYLRSNGLSKDYWYDTSAGRLSTNQILSKEPVIFIKSHSDTFDNAILLNIQECIKNLKNALRSEKESTQNTKKTPDTN